MLLPKDREKSEQVPSRRMRQETEVQASLGNLAKCEPPSQQQQRTTREDNIQGNNSKGHESRVKRNNKANCIISFLVQKTKNGKNHSNKKNSEVHREIRQFLFCLNKVQCGQTEWSFAIQQFQDFCQELPVHGKWLRRAQNQKKSFRKGKQPKVT